jgi:hypothetical protein
MWLDAMKDGKIRNRRQLIVNCLSGGFAFESETKMLVNVGARHLLSWLRHVSVYEVPWRKIVEKVRYGPWGSESNSLPKP